MTPSNEKFHFADRLMLRVRELGHPLCVGLDPHLELIPPLFRRGSMRAGDAETADAVRCFVFAVIDRLEGRTSVVKPQSAFYEQLGPAGATVLSDVIRRSRDLGLLVLLDAKRGDIGSTADAYARAYLEPGSAMAAEALTLNAYLGLDSLELVFSFREAGLRVHLPGSIIATCLAHQPPHRRQRKRSPACCESREKSAGSTSTLGARLVMM